VIFNGFLLLCLNAFGPREAFFFLNDVFADYFLIVFYKMKCFTKNRKERGKAKFLLPLADRVDQCDPDVRTPFRSASWEPKVRPRRPASAILSRN
jgi:hypothetical protein